jgi:hypothetical protein
MGAVFTHHYGRLFSWDRTPFDQQMMSEASGLREHLDC